MDEVCDDNENNVVNVNTTSIPTYNDDTSALFTSNLPVVNIDIAFHNFIISLSVTLKRY